MAHRQVGVIKSLTYARSRCRAAVAPGSNIRRFERPRAERRSRPDATILPTSLRSKPALCARNFERKDAIRAQSGGYQLEWRGRPSL